MRLGILVPKNLLQGKTSLIKEKYNYIAISFFIYSSIFDIPLLLQEKQKDLDQLLFFGETTMKYTASKITPTIPWDIIPRTTTTVLLILFEALLSGKDICKLAMDLHAHEKKILYESYREAGIDIAKVSALYAPELTFDESFTARIKEFYYKCLERNPSTTCITIYSEVYNQLTAEGFPILFLFPTLFDIYNGIEKAHSNFLLQISRESQLVIIYIVIDEASEYSPLTEDEYQMTLEALAVAKFVHLFAKKIQGAVLPIKEREFLIFSTRSIIENKTDNFRHFSLINDIQKNTASTVSIGIGFGKTALEAKTHAKLGIKKAQKGNGNQIYLVYDKYTVRGPIPKQEPSLVKISDRFLYISAKTGISAFTLSQIHKIINEQERTEFTPAEISNLLNVSLRSVNRTILKLIDAGYCFEIGKKFQQKGGRPSRILKFKF
ncbi:hypothetical protein ACSZOP_08005 [Colibacter massiliensis]|uniref:hypothetical protein n=1 Tax=Colibacter massiliensis TaxID=1852379 RepID=UPI003F92B432